MRTFQAKVRAGGVVNDVIVQARSITSAKRLLEAQYGKGLVFAVRESR